MHRAGPARHRRFRRCLVDLWAVLTFAALSGLSSCVLAFRDDTGRLVGVEERGDIRIYHWSVGSCHLTRYLYLYR